MVPAEAFDPDDERVSGPRATDDSKDLIVPSGDSYELSGTHTYTRSVQINGTLKVKSYDGSGSGGTLTLAAPWITVGSEGKIQADGRGYGGGGGATSYSSSQPGGKGGTGGKGGNGANSVSGRPAGGGGGGSNGGAGGTSSYQAGQAGTETGGGAGGTYSSYSGGKGGSGYGGGGGGGGCSLRGGGGGGGGGTGGKDATTTSGADGGGPFLGRGGTGTSSYSDPIQTGRNGGYQSSEANGDTTTDFGVVMGSGGGGGGTASNYNGGAGGGGAGGGSVLLVSSGNLSIGGSISTAGAGGGAGGKYSSYTAGQGGGGAGGGILVSGLKVTITGALDARGRNGDNLATTNGGTVKVFYESNDFGSAMIQAGRTHTNGRPKMQGLTSPEDGGTALLRPDFEWKAAVDPESETVTYQLQVAASHDFAATELDVDGIQSTAHTSTRELIGPEFYWRVRARDAAGYGSWSETRRFVTDVTPPVSHVVALPRYTNSTSFTVSWTGTDDSSGIASYSVYSAEGSGPFGIWLKDTPNRSAVFEGNEGVKFSFFSSAVDRAKNRESERNRADACTTVDATPPTSNIVSLKPGQSSLSFQVSWSGKDAVSGIRSYDIFVSDSDKPYYQWQTATTKTSAKFEGEEGHEYAFYSTACDNAGNYEEEPSPNRVARTRVDLTAPVTDVRPGEPSFGRDPTFITPATPIYLDGSDNYAGICATFYSIDGRESRQYGNMIKEGAPGFHNMTYWSVDKGGNKETAGTFWFFVDGEAPVTSVSYDGPNLNAGTKVFVSAQTSVALEAVDGGSGVGRVEHNLDNRGYVIYTTPLKFESAGTHTLLYRSADRLGNLGAEQSVKLAVDVQPPATKSSAESTVLNTDISVKLTAADTDSGVGGTFFRVVRERTKAGDYQPGTDVVIAAADDHSLDGNYTVQYYSVDMVGNTEKVKDLKVRIDTQVFVQLGSTGGGSVSSKRFLLEGKAEPGSMVTVNGEAVPVSADGSFSQEVELRPGSNLVLLSVTDAAGNSIARSISVTYNEPLTGTGWFAPLVALVIIAVMAGAGVFWHRRRKKRA